MSAVANSYPDRVAGLVYLEAAYPYAFDNGEGPSMKEFEISGPPGLKRSESDLATFSALRKWYAEANGFWIPEAEFRQLWESDLLRREHFIFLSNEVETLREMRSFLRGLK